MPLASESTSAAVAPQAGTHERASARAAPASRAYGWPELGLVLALHALLFALLNGNFDHDFDAQQYGRIAHEISHGEYVLATHPFSQRFAVTVPAALCFLLLGTNWLAATLWPLICSLGTILVVHHALRRTTGRRAAFVGAFLLAVNLIQVRYASRLLPDVVVSAFMICAALLVERGRSTRGLRQVSAGLWAAGALFVAFLAKATVIWAAPFFAGLLLLDLVRGRNRRLWAGFLAGSVACAALFFGAYRLFTGDALYRLEGIESIHNTRAGFFEGGLAQFAHRLTYGPLVYLIERPGFGLALLMALPAIVLAARAPRRESASARFWSAYALVVMGSFWFGTTSLKIYTPLYLADRFLMPFLAPLSILGAISITRVLDASGRGSRSRLELAPLLMGAAAAATLLLGDGIKRAALYAALAVVGALVAKRSSSSSGPMTALILAAMAVPLADYATRGDPHETPTLIRLERELIDEVARAEDLRGPAAVFTDPHSVFVLPFYLSAGEGEDLRFVSWDDPEAELRPGERALFYVHQPRLIAVNLNWGQRLPPFTGETIEGWRPLREVSLEDHAWIRLYEVTPEQLPAALGR